MTDDPLPSFFLSHGAPTLSLDPGATGAFWQRLALELPRPNAVLCVSSHWMIQEPARRTAALLKEAGIACAIDSKRGLDHGAWVPLRLMYPAADVPTIQLSIQPRRDAAWHPRLGAALAP